MGPRLPLRILCRMIEIKQGERSFSLLVHDSLI